MPKQKTEVIKVAELARRLSASETTVRKWARNRRPIPTVVEVMQTPGGQWRFRVVVEEPAEAQPRLTRVTIDGVDHDLTPQQIRELRERLNGKEAA